MHHSAYRVLVLLALGSGLIFCGCQATSTASRIDSAAPFAEPATQVRVPVSTGTPATPLGLAPREEPVDPALRSTVRQLTSADFIERSHASERLVRAGLLALPALGAAGGQPVMVHGETRVSTTRPVIQAILQDAEPDQVTGELSSPFPGVRRGAAEEVGRRGRWQPIPQLIVRLEDAHPAVRSAAAASLRRLTNNFFGYSAQANVRRRDVAAARWQSWWTQEGRLRQPTDGRTAFVRTR